jgi:cell division septal protein FtsQ
VRINLLDQNKKRRGRRRSTRTFDTVLVQPQLRTGRHIQKHRARPKPKPQPVQAQELGLSAAQKRMLWNAVLRRLPVALILAGLITILVYTSTAAEFFVYEPRVVGAHHLDPLLIYQMSGVHEQNIFWVQPQEASEHIRQLTGIKNVRVRCSLMPTQVTIEVEEREPAILLRAITQQHDWWLDEDGIVLPYHGDPNSPDIRFLVDASGRNLKEGDQIQPDGLAASVKQLAVALPEIRVFFYQSDRGLSFTQQLNGQEWPVYVGDSKDLPRKIQVLQALTSYFRAQNVRPRYVDVRWASHPVYGGVTVEASAGGD